MKKSARQNNRKVSSELLACIPPQYRQYPTEESDPPSMLPSARKEEPELTPEEMASPLLDYIRDLIAKRICTAEKELKDRQQTVSSLIVKFDTEKNRARREAPESRLALSSAQKEEEDLLALLSQLRGVQECLLVRSIFQEQPTWGDFIKLLNAVRLMVEAFGNEAITNAMAGVRRKHKNQEKSILQKTSTEAVQAAVKLREETGKNDWAIAGIISKEPGKPPRRTIYNNLHKRSAKNKQ